MRVHAEIWKCGDGRYTDRPLENAQCVPVSGSKVCGAGGNKIFSPSREGLPVVDEKCETTGKSKSPFVNEALAKLHQEEAKKRDVKAQAAQAPAPSKGGCGGLGLSADNSKCAGPEAGAFDLGSVISQLSGVLGALKGE